MTAVALTPESNGKGITALVVASEQRLAPLLPEGVTLQAVASNVYFATKKNPELLKCDGHTIVEAIARILRWGLVVGETGHLVPFGRTCTAVADYKGIAALMIASRAVRAVEGECVYEGDEFTYKLGLEARLDHSPVHKGARGAMRGAYVILRLPGGMSTFKYMAIEDIDAIRLKHSRQWKQGACPPWYAVKTVIRQLAKTTLTDPRLAKALAVIQEEEHEELEIVEPTGSALPSSFDPDDADVTHDDSGDDADFGDGALALGDEPKARKNAVREGR